jgi:hypothetical protein
MAILAQVRRAAGVLFVLAGLGLAGCATPTGTAGSPSGSNPIGTVSASTPTTPTISPTTPGPTQRPTAQPTGEFTVTGTVEQGAEPSCLLLPSGGVRYLLMGGSPSVVFAGARVSVTGHVVTGIVTHCMAGIPFQVVQAQPAG